MSINDRKEELINDLELEMKSNNNTNSEIISIDEMPKKEIIEHDKSSSDPYTEIKLIKKEIDNNLKLQSPSQIITEKPKDGFGDLTSIIRNKIKSKNNLENNKTKKLRFNSASKISTADKKKRMNLDLNTSTTKTNYSIVSNGSKVLRTKGNSSMPKNKNNNKNNTNIKKGKKNPELYVNKGGADKNKKGNLKTHNSQSSMDKGSTTTKKSKKINFNDVLKRFDEEKKLAQQNFDKKKKALKDQETLENPGKPKLNKKSGKKTDKFAKDFLTRQKEMSENLNKKKKKLIEEDNKKKEKEYKQIVKDSVNNKKKYRRNRSDDQWVERLYKEDTKRRKVQLDIMQNASIPTFKPTLPPRRHMNRSVERTKTSEIGDVLDKYNEKQNPQLLIDYMTRNENNIGEESHELMRQKIFNKSSSKAKKRSNSMDVMDDDKGEEEEKEEEEEKGENEEVKEEEKEEVKEEEKEEKEEKEEVKEEVKEEKEEKKDGEDENKDSNKENE